MGNNIEGAKCEEYPCGTGPKVKDDGEVEAIVDAIKDGGQACDRRS